MPPLTHLNKTDSKESKHPANSDSDSLNGAAGRRVDYAEINPEKNPSSNCTNRLKKFGFRFSLKENCGLQLLLGYSGRVETNLIQGGTNNGIRPAQAVARKS